MASDPGEGCFDKHSSSFNSTSSQTPLNDRRQQTFSPNTLNTEAEPAENTTYFLLDIEDDQQQERAGSTLSFEHSSDTSSSRSSRSSVSAQVVIDHGNSLPRRLDKHVANHVFRSDNDESESDYAYSYAHHDHADKAMTPERSPSQRSGERMQEEDSYQLTSKDQKRVSRDHIRNESYDADHENGKGVMTVYTEEDEDLAEELPTWDQERIREQQELSSDVPDDHHRPKQKRHAHDMHQHQRKMKKRLPKGINADLHSHSWSRRESIQNLRRPGLSSEEALQRLLTTARQILEDERARICKTICVKDWLLKPWMLLSLVTALSILTFYIAGYYKSDPYQYRVTGALVEALLILAMAAWNGYLYQREQKMTLYEMTTRATTIIDALERSGMNMVQDTRIPFVPSVSVAKVVRDGVVRIFPVNLLVEGDVVEMLYGDVAPGRMKYIHKSPQTTESDGSVHDTKSDTTLENLLQTREYYLAKDQTFKPSFFGIPPPAGLMEEYLRARGRHQFVLLETPLERNMRKALLQQRPRTVFAAEAQKLERLFYHRIVWAVLLIAVIVNLLRFGLRDTVVFGYPTDQLAEMLATLPFYAILPLLPLCLPSLWLVARSFGNAQLLILFEALQISKTEYEDEDEDDEFDTEAPPPTKDVELSPNVVWDRFISLLTKWDKMSLTRSTNLLESLGSTTVICCLDREGTIANPFPTVEQIMFPGKEDIQNLDVAEDSEDELGVKFEDRDWENHISCLKPLGLNFMLNTNCGVLQGRKRSEYHRRRSRLHVYGKTAPARQTCLCRLGKRIGFKEDALQTFASRAEIYTFAPYHDILYTPRYEYSQYLHFEVPNSLSTVFEETETGSYQLLTDGHPALVLDKCSDYWDGSGLSTMSEAMEKKIKDFYWNSMVHDMQCIAYAYRPINTAHGGRIPFLDPAYTDEEEPGCAFVVLPYKPPSSDASSTSSSSSGSSEVSSSSSMDLQMSLERWSSNGRGSGAFSSKKAPRKRTIRKLSKDTLDSSSGDESSDYSFEEDEPFDEQEEETFYKEVVKGQIFLGMTAMCHQPKQNVVDFIEDLGLAGIRFVNFSPTAERESKAFAERLGLETDWNSCILLSSPDDEFCGNGYLQTHDIKAQLPRGIDQIRHHLEQVDDIPLHVSLFAECTPRAIKGMIGIFQEYGEVVCCIGNALNAKNTEAFAMADMSIAMEPMHTRAQSRGRLALNGRQPPLAVGASLVSLPCALFMQYETSLYAVTQMIRDARRLLNCIRMGFAFYAGSCMSLSLMQLLSYCMLLPPIFTGYQILWIMCIILPIVTLSMLFTPHDDNLMLLMPGKNHDHLVSLGRFMVYFVLRFFPVVAMCIIIYALTLAYTANAEATQVFGHFGDAGWLHWSGKEQWAVLYAQNFMLIALVWHLTCISATFLHRTFSVIHFIPFKNRVWVGAAVVIVALQFCFCAVSLHSGPYRLDSVPWFVFLLGFAWPIVLVPIQELVKMHDNKEFTRFQKRSKLEFSTKLGMHSPL
ncbi:hypothetical protein VTP01DRAFT_5418 [Rhizomucor pusillus]|uniref:uncharacterized protein n=1 Tax=Rhizomucor pusillus TaxID=4840 RepID=UPI0037444E9A